MEFAWNQYVSLNIIREIKLASERCPARSGRDLLWVLRRSFEKKLTVVVGDDEVNVVGCGWLQKTIVFLVLRLNRQITVDPIVHIWHAYYTFLSLLDYKFLFSYLQIWRSCYAILSATTHSHHTLKISTIGRSARWVVGLVAHRITSSQLEIIE